MSANKKIITALSYFLLTILIFYVKYAPIILNPLLSDVVTVFLFSATVMAIVFLSFKVRTKLDILLTMPAAIIVIFLVRAIPSIILYFPPITDSYYHFVCTENILSYGTIQSHVGWWYSQSDMQLNWPMMHILTTELTTMSGLDPMFYFKFLMPFIGVIFFLGIFTLTYDMTKKYGISLLAGMIGALSATTIYYQSEYHPQALALTLFVYILIGFFRSRSNSAVPFFFISLIFISAFTLSHHFSTLFMSLICLMMIAMIVIGRKVPLLKKWLSFLSPDITFLSIIVITIFSFYIYTNPALLQFLFAWSLDTTPISGSTPYVKEPLISTVLNLPKWIPIVIVLLSVPSILLKKNKDLIRPLLILFLIMAAGTVGLFLLFLPLDRLLAFSMPIIGAICSIVLFQFFESKTRVRKTLFIVAIIALSLTSVAGIFSSQTPAYFFKTSGPDPYYWYNNDPPNVVEAQSSGLWSINSIESNKTYVVTLASWAIPFYYGKNPLSNVYRSDTSKIPDYYVINKNAEYEGRYPLEEIEERTSKIYSGPNISFFISGT